MKAMIAILAVFCVIPIWLYLLYKILIAVQATELMWFLFYIYCPATIIVAVAIEAIRGES